MNPWIITALTTTVAALGAHLMWRRLLRRGVSAVDGRVPFPASWALRGDGGAPVWISALAIGGIVGVALAPASVLGLALGAGLGSVVMIVGVAAVVRRQLERIRADASLPSSNAGLRHIDHSVEIIFQRLDALRAVRGRLESGLAAYDELMPTRPEVRVERESAQRELDCCAEAMEEIAQLLKLCEEERARVACAPMLQEACTAVHGLKDAGTGGSRWSSYDACIAALETVMQRLGAGEFPNDDASLDVLAGGQGWHVATEVEANLGKQVVATLGQVRDEARLALARHLSFGTGASQPDPTFDAAVARVIESIASSPNLSSSLAQASAFVKLADELRSLEGTRGRETLAQETLDTVRVWREVNGLTNPLSVRQRLLPQQADAQTNVRAVRGESTQA